MKKTLSVLGLSLALLSACAPQQKENLTLSGLDPVDFETTVDAKAVKLYTLKNASGMEVCITNFGGRLVSVMVPDKEGKPTDVILGFDNITDYQNVPTDFGASIGRYANRINQGKIVVDGVEYQLPQNNYGHCLHGGPDGWQYKVYEAKQLGETKLELVLNSPDGDSNFPGNVVAKVTYTLTEDNAIDIAYEATTDKTTVINMTNHAYFNLNGDPSVHGMNQVLYIASDSITPVDATFMTTGEMMAVAGTPFDFNAPKAIEQDIQAEDEQLAFGKGYDHNWVLKTKGDITKVAAKLSSPVTGITMEVYTNEPGVQVYTGNFLNGTVKGKKGIVYPLRASVCLETQHYPDTPNKNHWPSAILKPGDTYRSQCIYKFGVE